jgi:hypothetical protein
MAAGRSPWSHGLRQRLLAGVPERSDEEIAEAEVGGEVVAVVPDEAWRVMVAEKGLMVAVLRAAEAGGFRAIVDVLSPYGVTVTRPPMTERDAGEQGDGQAPQKASPQGPSGLPG